MMENAGFKSFAWIYSPGTFSALAAQKSVDVKLENVVTQFFTSRNDAKSWLQQL